VAQKIAALEAFDLIRVNPERDLLELAAAEMFTSGMAAISAAILARVHSGDTIIVQESLYSGTFVFLKNLAPTLGIHVVWLHNPSPEAWEAAFQQNPSARLALAETPANPMMDIVDLAAVAETAHRHDAWLMVDNTFATPYCQRPLRLGADIVVHSTTKYLSGHGAVVGGVAVSRHVDFIHKELHDILKTLGGSPSPFDCWLTHLGLKTFELRMQRHCENAVRVANYLTNHPKVERVFYPGLDDHPSHGIAKKQMHTFGGMITFELSGGMEAGIALMNHLRLVTLAVSLGNVDSLIQHPASMTHHNIPREERLKVGLTDGLVRFSVGIENVEDILADLEQALEYA
jgi:methionine-gamma-lyase